MGNALACTGFLFKQALNIWGDQMIKKLPHSFSAAKATEAIIFSATVYLS